METEHLTDRELAEYVRGQASPEALLQRDDHLSQCADCRARLRAIAPAAGLLNWQRNMAAVEPEVPHLAYELLIAPATELPADAQEHLRHCARCREERAELTAAPQQQPRPIRKPAVWKWLAPLALAAALTAIFVLWKPAAPPQPPALAEIHDAGGSITLRAGGTLEAPAAVPAADRVLIAQVLESATIPLAPAPADVQSRTGTLLGPSTSGDPFAPLAPMGVVVLSDRPEFRWQPLPAGADWYRVQVYDSDFNEVAASDRVTRTSWTPAQPLARGRLYQWQVTARSHGRDARVPAPPAKEARFRVLDASAAAKIGAARAAAPLSHLLVAVLCAQAGLREEASAELDQLQAENPSAPLVTKLRAGLR